MILPHFKCDLRAICMMRPYSDAMDPWIIAGTIGSLVAAAGVLFTVLNWIVTKRMDARETSSRDVAWGLHRVDAGEFRITNVGTVDALNAVAVLAHGQETVVVRAVAVGSTDSLLIRSEMDAELRRQAQDEDAAYQREFAASPFPVAGPMSESHEIRLLISWAYPSGIHDRQEIIWTETY